MELSRTISAPSNSLGKVFRSQVEIEFHMASHNFLPFYGV